MAASKMSIRNGLYNLTKINSSVFAKYPPEVSQTACILKSFAYSSKRYCSTQPALKAFVNYSQGSPVFHVPLPSRQDMCLFPLKPLTHTVGDLINFIREEDHGIDKVLLYDSNDVRFSKFTSVDSLLKTKFRLVINESSYEIEPPEQDLENEEICKMKNLIAALYTRLNVEDHQRHHEQRVLKKLENLRAELEPLEKVKEKLDALAKKRAVRLKWVLLTGMGLQCGLFARLTWWEYSWDIMEPVTYFATYSTVIAMFAYFVATNQQYDYPATFDRQELLAFHKKAKKVNFDIHHYNWLKNEIYQAEYDLKRLRDPLQLNLPIAHLKPMDALPTTENN